MERFAEDLAAWLTEAGHEVTVVTKTPAGPAEPARPYAVVRSPDWSAAADHIARAEAVHVNGLSVRASIAVHRAGARPVVTHAAHQAICPVGIASGVEGAICTASGARPGPCSVCLRRGPTAWLNVRAQRLAARRAAVNVCISDYLQQRLDVPRSTTIYNPVSADAFAGSGVDREPDQIVFVGRLAQEKGPALVLRAIDELPDARLVLVGDGPQRGELERLTDDLGVRARVTFLGSLSRLEVLRALRSATIACVPTTCEEAFGYSAAEAMATGTPVVATPSGALPELLADGRGLIAASIGAAALAASLRVALTDRQASAQRAALAAQFARERLHVDATGPAYLAAYRSASSDA